MDIPLILLSFLITLALTHQTRKTLLARNLLDRPNERSSHKTPVPRGGGWALLILLIPGMLITGLRQNNLHTPLIIGTTLLALISWLDDKKPLNPALRLGTHILAAYLGTLCFPPHATIFANTIPFALDRAITILGWAWFMNLYNFMDGIDGITGSETIALATGTCLIMTATGTTDPFTSTLTLLLTGSCLGFLAFNWHPAKIFLGDIGSVPLGYLTGFGLITLAIHGHTIPALILPLYYLADSGITLAKRALRREKIWQAHREHFYQQAAQKLGRHDKVVLRITATNTGLIASALLATAHPLAGLALAVALVALLLGNLHKQGHVRPAP